MAPPLPNRHRLMSDVVEWVGKNWTLDRIAARPEMPSRQTLHRWMAASPTFAQQVAAARMRARAEMRQARFGAWEGYHDATAQAFLHRVRCGDRVNDLVRRPEWPHRERLDRWKAQRPDFAAALAQAVAYARRYRRRAFDAAAADALLIRLMRGEPLAEARGAERGLPGRRVIRRWRKGDEGFAGGYAAAKLRGHRRRMRARSKCTPELVAKIVDRIERGDSLHSVARWPGMPHHVTLYGWIKSRPAFAAAVRAACEKREWILREQALMRLDGETDAEIDRFLGSIGAVRRRVSTMPRWPGDGRRGGGRGSPP